ncbi:hypothetical protein FOC1_g10000153 [Fusarium oxysporum f. sp. cubense race 1]|uniref:Uncharacterized protein n=3 Tax=Fusarium oxysporum f. sp. cubense TaxID=61366 RepID=N4TSM7_FUSC1|nr:hypothetical protein FOC1_g10000153 [Fusarium oxysporum f. sp. cubense race 1]
MGHRGIVQLLLDHGTYVDTRCERYGTALMLMSSLRLRDIAKVHHNIPVMPNHYSRRLDALMLETRRDGVARTKFAN